MTPNFRIRLLMAGVIAVGSAAWIAASPALRAIDGGAGASLTQSAWPLPAAIGWVLLAGLPALGGCVLVARLGSPVGGVFTVASSVTILAAWGGRPEDWLLRAASRAVFPAFLAEILFWAVVIVIVPVALTYWVGRYGAGPSARTGAVDAADPPPPALAPEAAEPGPTRMTDGRPELADLTGGLITLVGGLALSVLLVRTSASAQVIWGLILGFGIAAAVSVSLTRARFTPILLLTPAAAGCLIHLTTWLRFESLDAVVIAWRASESPVGAGWEGLTPLALALPMHFVGAGVVGVAMGVGIGRSIVHAQHGPTVRPDAEPVESGRSGESGKSGAAV